MKKLYVTLVVVALGLMIVPAAQASFFDTFEGNTVGNLAGQTASNGQTWYEPLGAGYDPAWYSPTQVSTIYGRGGGKGVGAWQYVGNYHRTYLPLGETLGGGVYKLSADMEKLNPTYGAAYVYAKLVDTVHAGDNRIAILWGAGEIKIFTSGVTFAEIPTLPYSPLTGWVNVWANIDLTNKTAQIGYQELDGPGSGVSAVKSYTGDFTPNLIGVQVVSNPQ